MTITETLRTARRSAGVLQRDLAERTGIASSSLSQIERGHRIASTETADRILAGLGVRLVPVHAIGYDAAGAASAIAEALRSQKPENAVRRFVQFSDDLRAASPADRFLLGAVRPASTGSRHWDAALAGLLEYSLDRDGVPAPEWTSEPDRFLNEPWTLSSGHYVIAVSDSDVPHAFLRRNVKVDAIFFESV